MSLRFRITLLVIVAIVLILGAATLMIDERVDNEVAQRSDMNLFERAQALADIFATQSKASALHFPSYRAPSFLADNGIVYFRIDCRGEHVVSSDEAASLAWPALPPRQSVAFADIADRQGVALRAVSLRFSPDSRFSQGFTRPFDDTAGANAGGIAAKCSLGLAVDHSEVLDFQESMDKIEFGSVVLGFLFVAILTPLLVTRGLRPLSGLAEAMEKIGPDTPQTRLEKTPIRELAPLTDRFNEVLSRMEEGLLRERQFASGVAHELRTPLAELRTIIEVEQRYPSGRDVSLLLAEIGEVGAEMQRIVTALLMLTRIEAGIEQIVLQPVDVTAVTYKVIARHQQRMAERKLVLHADIEPGVSWVADETLLDVVLGNLLGNAAAYAPGGSTIVLQCAPHIWSVTNQAPELTLQDVARMKQRFWRKGKDAGVHTGLGLALAASAAQAQALRLELSLQGQDLQASIHP